MSLSGALTGSLSEKELEARRLGLQDYLQLLLTTLNWFAEESLREFLQVEKHVQERRLKPAAADAS